MKVAICVPCYGGTKWQFTYSLAKLLLHPRTFDIEPFFSSCSVLPWLREQLADQAISAGADWILWIDSDMTFPPDALARLLAHDLPVVATNYPRREIPVSPIAVQDGKRVQTGTDSPPLEEVTWTGLGLCLVRTDILQKAERPLFGLTPTIGEDAWFFAKLGIAGHSPVIDSALSMDIGHVAEVPLRLKGSA